MPAVRNTSMGSCMMFVWGIILPIMTIALQRYSILIGMDLTKAALMMVSDNVAESSSIYYICITYNANASIH